jgi:hypothetical protein
MHKLVRLDANAWQLGSAAYIASVGGNCRDLLLHRPHGVRPWQMLAHVYELVWYMHTRKRCRLRVIMESVAASTQHVTPNYRSDARHTRVARGFDVYCVCVCWCAHMVYCMPFACDRLVDTLYRAMHRAHTSTSAYSVCANQGGFLHSNFALSSLRCSSSASACVAAAPVPSSRSTPKCLPNCQMCPAT